MFFRIFQFRIFIENKEGSMDLKNRKTVTISELAEILGLSDHAIRSNLWRGSDMPPRIKVGRRVLFPVEELDAWLSRKKERMATGVIRKPGRPRKGES